MRMRSKYTGKCRTCGGRIEKGEIISWLPGAGATHIACAPDTSQKPSVPTDAAPQNSARRPSLLDRIIILLPLCLGPAMVLTNAKTALPLFLGLPAMLAILNNGLSYTGGRQRMGWGHRPQLKADLYISAIMAMAIISAIPGLVLWIILQFIE